MFEDDDSVFAAMRAGARGYVLKDMDADDFAHAIVAVGRGEALFSRGIATRMMRFFSEPRPSTRAFPDLTDSERGVLRLMATGANNAAISRELSLSPKRCATTSRTSSANFRSPTAPRRSSSPAKPAWRGRTSRRQRRRVKGRRPEPITPRVQEWLRCWSPGSTVTWRS